MTSFLGTPLETKGRTVGVLAVDNRLSGRDVERSIGPLLSTVGNLLAAAVENARLYGEIEDQNRELEARVARRTAQLAEATEEAQAARATAEAMSATKCEFLANVSHELRTPLTSVIGFTKIVRRRLDEVVLPALAGARETAAAPDDPRLERAVRQVGDNLEIVVAEGERLSALINDVLDLEKIEAGKMEFRHERVDVGEVVERATTATTALFETTGLELRREIAPDLPAVDGDPHRLVQVVINLLSNAVKFTPTGSVTVRVVAADGGSGVVVSVVDTGTGIAPRTRPGSSSSSPRPATRCPRRLAGRASASRSAARSSSTTAAGSGSRASSVAARRSRSACPGQPSPTRPKPASSRSAREGPRRFPSPPAAASGRSGRRSR